MTVFFGVGNLQLAVIRGSRLAFWHLGLSILIRDCEVLTMCQTIVKFLIWLILLLLGVVGCGSATSETEAILIIPSVTTSKIESGKRFTQKSYLGYARAKDRAELSFKVAGKIKALDLDIGDVFERGQVLSQLDSLTAELSLKEVEASLNQAQYDQENAQLEYNRRKTLVEKSLVSDAEVDLWKLRLDSARAQVNALQAKRDIAKKTLLETHIIAPYNGQVTNKFVQTNQHVSPNQPVLAVRSIDTGIEVLARIPYQHVNRPMVGESVSLNTLDDKQLLGKVSSVNTQISSNGLVELLVVLDEKYKNDIFPGAPLNVFFNIENSIENYSIPLSALQKDTQDGHYVWLVDRKTQTVSKKTVQIQRLKNNIALVSGDLAEGSDIVRFGGKTLTNGQRVKLKEP